jgi:short-subunit dehydrogenase
MTSTVHTPKKTALITGPSSGIGLELTKIFADRGFNLVLVSRNEKKLLEMAGELGSSFGVSVKVIAKDLSSASAAEEIFDEIQRHSVTIDVLVNNAGLGSYGPFAESDLAAQQEMMQVNMVSLTQLTRLFLPGMLHRGEGKILNVASTAGFQPGPLMAVYYATKAYVLLFSEALANELKGTGVTVSTLCPGPTTTGFQRRARMEESRLVRGPLMDARSVAQIGYDGLMKNKTIVVPGLMNKVGVFSLRLIPRKMVTRIVRKVMAKNEG